MDHNIYAIFINHNNILIILYCMFRDGVIAITFITVYKTVKVPKT